MRTRLNVQDSDGTLLVSFDPELSGGSAFTEKTAERMRKPYLHLVLPDRGATRVPDEVRAGVLEWISDCKISVLNVAGPRESKAPGLQEAVRDLLVWIFEPDAPDDAPATTPEEQATAEAIGQELVALGVGPATVEVVERQHVGADGKIDKHTVETPDGTFTIPAGTPVRWGGVEPMAVKATDPNAFDPSAYTFVEGECISIIQPEGDGPAVCIEGWDALKRMNEREDAERNFIANCENTVNLLPTVDAELRSGALVEVKALVELFYTFPNNGAGGSLHIVLDDGNTGRDSVEYCLTYAQREGDACGEALAKLLLALTEEERESL
jgi:hypothetical protein